MTIDEFNAKWGSVYTEHSDGCKKKFSCDFNECSCGHDILWAMRNADIATVPEAELAAWRRDNIGKR
jgi:hypothetical protein